MRREVYRRDYSTRFNGADRLTLRSRAESRRSEGEWASQEKIHGPASAGELMRPGRSREEISLPTCAASAIKKRGRDRRGHSFFLSFSFSFSRFFNPPSITVPFSGIFAPGFTPKIYAVTWEHGRFASNVEHCETLSSSSDVCFQINSREISSFLFSIL